MILLAHAIVPLLGQGSRVSTMGQRFRGSESGISAGQLLLWGLVLAVVVVVLWRIVRASSMRDGRSYTSPKRLFQELCRLHALDWPSRRLLRQIAKVHQLEHPASVFLQPALFDPQTLKQPLQPFRKQIGALRQRLFG